MATSINTPSLSNAIRNDVPAIKTILQALAKSDPSVLSDIENGTKRFYEGTNGWEFQELVNGSWITRTNFNIDAQSVDGYNTSVDATASTIPVRGTDGKIKGDITGNAATATKATALTSTLAVASGGTGATTPADARTNLGVPPISHASTATTHGIGTSTNYGHVKLSDATDSTSAESAGIAATPKAVSTGLDGLMDDVITAANNAVTGNTSLIQSVGMRVDELASNKADKFVNNKGVVRTVNGLNADGDGNVDIPVVTSVNGVGADASGNIDIPIASATPVGTVIAFAGSADPAGYLLCNGAAVSRTAYAALFAVIGTTYGAGDGSTTFSLPDLTDRFIQGSATPGTVKEAGLPNITGSIEFDKGTAPFNGNGAPASGAFYSSTRASNYAEPGVSGGQCKMHIDASRSSAVYGKSTTVQPPALTLRYCIKY